MLNNPLICLHFFVSSESLPSECLFLVNDAIIRLILISNIIIWYKWNKKKLCLNIFPALKKGRISAEVIMWLSTPLSLLQFDVCSDSTYGTIFMNKPSKYKSWKMRRMVFFLHFLLFPSREILSLCTFLSIFTTLITRLNLPIITNQKFYQWISDECNEDLYRSI